MQENLQKEKRKMISNSVHNKIHAFLQREENISVRRLRSLTLANKNIPFKIWGETLEGDSYDGREVFTFFGPSRNPGVAYNYNAMGYMIMYDMNKGDYRTFVYDNITKLELNGKIYKIN
jgi:hypothetical protein